MYNPFAEAWLPDYDKFENLIPTYGYHVAIKMEVPNFFNRNLTLTDKGEIELKKAPNSRHTAHDYSGESHYTASTYDFTVLEIEDSLKAQISRKSKVGSTKVLSRVAWIVPDFSMPFYGGVLTILRTAEFMRSKHHVQQIFVGFGAASAENLRIAISKAYPDLAKHSEIYSLLPGQDINTLNLGELDASICTLWTTAYPMLGLRNVRQKFYFVQDYEPLFYPAGSTSLLAEATYKFGYIAICNTQSLAELYRELGGEAYHFDPSVDENVFYLDQNRKKDSSKPVLIFSYARPGHPRNCFEIIAAAFKDVKSKLGDQVQIITAGADWAPREYALEGVVEHLGLLSYEQTGDLYRACDIGVVAMATRHPSYLPFELMACGAVTITNRSRYTDWLLKDGENAFLFEMSRSSVSETIISAVRDPSARAKISATASTLVQSKYNDWDRSCGSIHTLICNGVL
jgi:glycosyltransferase involved in cell wall biosynthesis